MRSWAVLLFASGTAQAFTGCGISPNDAEHFGESFEPKSSLDSEPLFVSCGEPRTIGSRRLELRIWPEGLSTSTTAGPVYMLMVTPPHRFVHYGINSLNPAVRPVENDPTLPLQRDCSRPSEAGALTRSEGSGSYRAYPFQGHVRYFAHPGDDTTPLPSAQHYARMHTIAFATENRPGVGGVRYRMMVRACAGLSSAHGRSRAEAQADEFDSAFACDVDARDALFRTESIQTRAIVCEPSESNLSQLEEVHAALAAACHEG